MASGGAAHLLALGRRTHSLHEDRSDAETLLAEALGTAERATAEVRELAHGILPSVLTHGGLRAGVDALASSMPVSVQTQVAVDRLPREVEASAYFIVAEALTNVSKHAHAQCATVTANLDGGALHIEVRDDGVGGAIQARGLVGLRDRVTALNGTFSVDSPPGSGTVVTATIPLRPSS